ncbi:MAG: 16S rRNA (guanine(527)-N(7))-methyltransferase RsmG [Eubacterium sp.]
MNNIEKIIGDGAQCGIAINENQATLLSLYMERILEANQKINVTRITDIDEFIENHILDSLTCLKFIDKKEGRILDVGTGGGFPGVPLAIMLKDAEITMMDSTGKKLKVIETICKELEINNVVFLHGRAEEFGKDFEFRETYDCVISRAVANLCLLSELCLPLVKTGGLFIALKGKNYKDEMVDGKKAIKGLGGKIITTETCLLLQSDWVHVIILVEKVNSTPDEFPRVFGRMKKEGFPEGECFT